MTWLHLLQGVGTPGGKHAKPAAANRQPLARRTAHQKPVDDPERSCEHGFDACAQCAICIAPDNVEPRSPAMLDR